jgi:RES domain-containing protein
VRISYLIGIFKSLNILYSQRLADRWMQLPNTNPIFAGRTPLDYILRGGTPAWTSCAACSMRDAAAVEKRIVMVALPITDLRRFDTHRLLPAKYSPNYDSVLTRIADDEDLQLIFELDNATNARLQAEENLSPGISPRELVFHVPNYRVINAAFTHANPLGARFSSPERGAWYAAFELATAKAEVLFHKSIEFAEIDWKEREEIGYDDYLADFTAPFHDLRGVEDEALSPTSYVRSQQLAVEADGAWIAGHRLSERSPRRGHMPGLFSPSIVANVRKSTQYRLIWTPLRARFVRRLAESVAGPLHVVATERRRG